MEKHNPSNREERNFLNNFQRVAQRNKKRMSSLWEPPFDNTIEKPKSDGSE